MGADAGPALSPGWVRYAERVLGQPLTPHLCTAKSPQQIMGSLVKDYFARRQVSSPLRPAAWLWGHLVTGAEGA